jgi:hypothetical protein
MCEFKLRQGLILSFSWFWISNEWSWLGYFLGQQSDESVRRGGGGVRIRLFTHVTAVRDLAVSLRNVMLIKKRSHDF